MLTKYDALVDSILSDTRSKPARYAALRKMVDGDERATPDLQIVGGNLTLSHKELGN